MIRLDPYLASRLEDVIKLCNELEVNELYFFGSAIDGRFDPEESDLDVLVSFDEQNITNIVKLKKELGRIYDIRVDIFSKKWVVNSEMQAYLKKWKVLIYRRENQLLAP